MSTPLSSPPPTARRRDELPPGIVPLSRHGRLPRLIGDVVVDLGFAERDAVEAAVAAARDQARTTGELLVEHGTLTADQLARVLAERFGVDYVDLGEFPFDHTAARLLPPDAARQYDAVPIGFLDDRTLLLATSDPANVVAIDDIAMMTGLDIHPLVASRTDLAALIAKLARLDDVAEAIEPAPAPEAVALTAADVSVGDTRPEDEEAPVIKLVHSVVAEAVELGASDVHFDPEGAEMRVHYRIDGVLSPASTIPGRMVRGVVSRVKIMASLDISERRVPQDGRLSLTIAGRTVDVRVVTLPLVQGESVVMRILDRGTGDVIALDGLGLHDRELDRVRHAVAQPYGAILVTGPTGSGKTTTLYGAMRLLNSGERSIVTIEDPVEYRIDGIKQLQVNQKVGVGFAEGLRSMVRADPDVIMVGEIRDRETAQIAIEAALTGHLVLSTLHTRDAPTAVARLADMGIERFLVASAIDCVVAQRLARTLCTNCRRETLIAAAVLAENGFAAGADLQAFEPVGCGRCGGTGYRGRIGLFEVMPVTEEIRTLVMRGASSDEITAAAVAGGMRRVRDDGLAKVASGMTSLAEVARVAGA
ncbi:MAG: Flp pilus assembly complex ATPase component TadA [Solirubrobacteraceae bacterium]|nr:Flp pilus assembly complex ATPase component TadA [Solirubrobacteraceae bacterium]